MTKLKFGLFLRSKQSESSRKTVEDIHEITIKIAEGSKNATEAMKRTKNISKI